MATFTVKRSEWYRGKGYEESKLLREDGKRCCIGFVGQQCGFTDERLLGISTVARSRYNGDSSAWPAWMLKEFSGEIQEAYTVNDRESITDGEREAQLKEIFKRNGYEIVFVD